MKIYRFLLDGRAAYGVLQEEKLHPLRGSVFDEFDI